MRSALQKDAHPAYFYLCSAQAAIERRRCAQKARDARGGEAPPPLAVRPAEGQFVGQVVLLEPPRRLTDDEFVLYLKVSPLSVRVDVTTQTLNLKP